jgi:signal transduction histidine kinase/CheY-like chemotaxis protein
MKQKKIIYFLLAAFIIGNIFIIYIQYNSTKNVNTLIDGNEKVIAELKVSNDLRELEKDIAIIDSKVAGTIYANNIVDANDLEIKIKEVQNDLQNLQKISDDDNSVKYIDLLDDLIQRKLLHSKINLATYKEAKQNEAIDIIDEKNLNDSIITTTQIIETSREKVLSTITNAINKSSKKAITFSGILIALVLISGSVLFWYIINTIKKQQQLIQDLNTSEKKLHEASKIKEKFLANMSHEIRTPMNAIIGFTNLLQKKELDDEAKDYVQTIEKSSENLLTVVNEILDLSKIEAGMMRIETSVFSINETLLSLENLFKQKAVEKKLNLIFEIDKTIPDSLKGDPIRLSQILINLINNAIKFTVVGNVHVNVSKLNANDKNIEIGICVSDTGIGIKKEDIKNIFERFTQAENDATRKYGGTGLGLSIVKELVELQGGHIEVKSEYEKGTSFTIIIPYAIVKTTINKRVIENKINIKTNFVNNKVLVVEDNSFNQKLIIHLFKNWGLAFDLVENGKEAVAVLKTNKYDAILMDMQMPEMDGYTATQQIRNVLKLDTPIIAMTAHALAGEREKCLSYGMNEYIAKPIREKQLFDLITTYTHLQNDTAEQKDIIIENEYKYINLQYMKEISAGNLQYEKSVTEQFIEAIPNEIELLENAFAAKDFTALKQIAHNMKTSISIMGLTEILASYLNKIEYDNLTEFEISDNIDSVKKISLSALQEAHLFLATF